MTTLSPIVAGTMTWGTAGKNLDTNQMESLIRLYLEHGINTFDHADIYGGYTTEAAFGKAFRQSAVGRDQVKFISKCGIRYPAEGKPYEVKHYLYSRDHIVQSVENSLQNLGTDHLDILLLHRPSPLMHPDEIAHAVEELKSAGKILDFGVSNFTSSQIDLIRSRTEVSYNQIEFSATNWEPMVDGSLDHMILNGIRPMAWSPLGCVFRTDTEQAKRVRMELIEMMAKYGVPGDVIMIAWILKHPAGVIPVCGTTSPERIAELMKATKIELADEDWFKIWVAARGIKVP
jgi:predicted oxidoreductase